MTQDERNFRPLAMTLARAVGGWTVLCMLVFGAAQGFWTYQTATERFRAEMDANASGWAKTLAEPMWTMDMSMARSILVMVSGNPRVGYVALFDASIGKVLAEAGNARLRTQSGAVEFVAPVHGFSFSHWTTDVPPRMAQKPDYKNPAGTLRIVMNPAALRQDVLKSVLQVLLPCAALGGLLLMVMLTLLRRQLQRPMGQLAQCVNALDANHLDRELDWPTPKGRHANEIDRVADGYRLLQGRIRQHVHELDALVAERTAELHEALKQLEASATTDALTGCFNRLLFNRRYPEEFARAKRYGRPLSAVFCDIDHFKAVNDTHGHAVGDQVLAAVGHCLRESLRSGGDWVVRYGGEEFVMVLPETPLAMAWEAAERVRQRVQDLVRVALTDGSELRVTLSLGVAQTQDEEHLGEELLRRADEHLYAAKRVGRNRVMPALESV